MTDSVVNGPEIIGGLVPFQAMEIQAVAKQMEAAGRQVIHLELGEPGATAAPEVLEAVRADLDRPQKYTLAKGNLSLRQRISTYYCDKHQSAVDPAHIVITTGSSAGFLLGFLGGFARGSAIAVTRPGYPAYLNILNGLGFEPVEIPLSMENGWRLTADDVAKAYAAQPFAGLLFASPANPTGVVLGATQLGDVVEVCAKLGVRIISDEIYHGLDYIGRSVSVRELSDAAIIINSFSKYYCMTGWRAGWMVLPGELVRQAEILQQNMFISAPSISQIAALAALDAEAHALQQKQVYARNRDVLAEGLARLGFAGALRADGAFYAYADASRFTNDSLSFCKAMLEKTGVATTPGVDFDRVNGHRFVRFSFAGAPDDMHQALEKMAGFLPQPS